MNKPFLTLTTKDFMTGIAPSAHVQGKGLFYKADGVSPLIEAGSSQSIINGLLTNAPAATTVSGSLVGSIISSCHSALDNGIAYFGTDSNHIFSLALDVAFGSTLTDAHTAGTTLTPGLKPFTDSSGNKYLFYRQIDQMGRYDGSSWVDNWDTTPVLDYFGAMHQFQKQIFFGNGAGSIGSINAAGTLTASVSTVPGGGYYTTAISDDGTYVILATTRNNTGATDLISETKIIFWDGADTQLAVRSFIITDPFVYALKKTPVGIFAFGTTGIWQVALEGVKKIFNTPPGVYTGSVGSTNIHYGNAVSFFSDAVIWGGLSGVAPVIQSLGKLDSSYNNAHLHPFLSTTAKNVTMVDAQLLKGYVFVADDTPLLKAYPFSGSGAGQTSVYAQTIYFEVPSPIQIKRLRVVFGTPLALGDSLSLDVALPGGNVSYQTLVYSASKTINSKSSYAQTINAKAQDIFGLKMTFNAGKPRVKKIDVYADAIATNDD